jgi:hypothetical protein
MSSIPHPRTPVKQTLTPNAERIPWCTNELTTPKAALVDLGLFALAQGHWTMVMAITTLLRGRCPHD